jgi:uncharacterized protein
MADAPGSERRFEGFVPGFWAIDAYGNGGFRFAGMSHRGSILATPSGVSIWPVFEPDAIDAASLAVIVEDGAGIDFLIIGTGATLQIIGAALHDMLRQQRISVEVMTTPAAISTYHVLAGEKRRVAAALIAVA